MGSDHGMTFTAPIALTLSPPLDRHAVRHALDAVERCVRSSGSSLRRCLLRGLQHRAGLRRTKPPAGTRDLIEALAPVPWQHWDQLITQFFQRFEGRQVRRKLGLYFTPPALARVLARVAIDGHARPPDRSSGPYSILDPACGVGNLLLAALEVLVADGWPPAAIAPWLYGVEVDPFVAEVARLRLALAARELGVTNCCWESQIVRADALRLRLPDESAELSRQRAWADLFPSVLARGDVSGFSVVLGNPPFANAIEGDASHWKDGASRRFPELTGTADRACHFLALGKRLVQSDGRVAMIQPQTMLQAPALRPFRDSGQGLRLNAVLDFRHARQFADALVFTCGVVLGPGEYCRMGRVDGSGEVAWHAILATPEKSTSVPPYPHRGGDQPRTVGDRFEVTAGLTTAEAYSLRPWLIDDAHATGPKLTTTGLIDPRQNFWGSRRCRFLGRDYLHPRIRPLPHAPAWLARRCARAARPKILVAGLATRLEAVLDANGEFAGSVGTYCITHVKDSLAHLAELLDLLLSEEANERFWHELGTNRVGGGYVIVRKSFLQNLSWRMAVSGGGDGETQYAHPKVWLLDHHAA
jgi:SAM-dependent methyltransferase